MSAQLPVYAELHCLSHFTFLRGASRPAELVQRAQQLGYRALAITDECSVAGVVRAHMAVQNCAGQSLKLIIGAEFTLACGLKFVALVTNRHGYARLCALITHGRRAAPKGSYHLTREDVQRHLADCLILWLPGATPAIAELQWLRSCFAGQLWIGVELLLQGTDRQYLAQLIEIGGTCSVPLAWMYAVRLPCCFPRCTSPWWPGSLRSWRRRGNGRRRGRWGWPGTRRWSR